MQSRSEKKPFAASVSRFVLVTVLAGLYLPASVLMAQEDSTRKKTSAADQTKIVRAIYDATKTVKSAKDLTEFLTQCQSALDGELSSANREYVVSLTGWALNRRGEKRFETAVQLQKVGNAQHETAMKQAMEDFDAAIIAAPTRFRSWMSRGIAHVENKSFDNAIYDFTKVTELKADEANGWFNRAEALYHRGNYEQAISDYNVVLRLDSDDAQAMTGRGLAAYAMGDSSQALVDFDQVIKLHPANDSAYINRGDVHQTLGEWKLANADFQRAIELEETGIACQRSAWLMATCPDPEIRDSKMAKTMIERAIALVGDTAINLDTLAATEAANGEFDSAKTNQQKVIGLVNAEEDVEVEQYQARLMLYEKSEPYLQKAESVSDDSKEK